MHLKQTVIQRVLKVLPKILKLYKAKERKLLLHEAPDTICAIPAHQRRVLFIFGLPLKGATTSWQCLV